VSPKPNPLRRAIHSRQPPPLSHQRSTSAHWAPQTRGGSARAGRTLQHVSIQMVKSAWAGDVRWVCSRAGLKGLLRTLHRQVRRLLARRAAQILIHCCAPSTADTHPPLSPQRFTSVHRTPYTRGGSARAGQRCSMSRYDGQQRLGGGRTVAAYSGRMDRDFSEPSTARFAGCLRVVAASPNPDGRLNTLHSTPLHGVHSTTEGHLGVNLLF
jgi:hypothetical protein